MSYIFDGFDLRSTVSSAHPTILSTRNEEGFRWSSHRWRVQDVVHSCCIRWLLFLHLSLSLWWGWSSSLEARISAFQSWWPLFPLRISNWLYFYHHFGVHILLFFPLLPSYIRPQTSQPDPFFIAVFLFILLVEHCHSLFDLFSLPSFPF